MILSLDTLTFQPKNPLRKQKVYNSRLKKIELSKENKCNSE